MVRRVEYALELHVSRGEQSGWLFGAHRGRTAARGHARSLAKFSTLSPNPQAHGRLTDAIAVRGRVVSVSVETSRSDDLYAGASPDGDRVEAERWPLLDRDGGRTERGARDYTIISKCSRTTCTAWGVPCTVPRTCVDSQLGLVLCLVVDTGKLYRDVKRRETASRVY